MITKAERWKVAGFSRQVDQMRDCSVRAGRAGEEIERYVLVVHGCECNVRVRPSGGIARNDELEQKKTRNHCDDDHMIAQRLPKEP